MKTYQLDCYAIEDSPTEKSAGGRLLYIGKRFSYQLSNNLQVYHPGKTQSTLIKIICSKSTVIVGCIYKHLTLQISDFTSDFISPLLLQKQLLQRVFQNNFLLEKTTLILTY